MERFSDQVWSIEDIRKLACSFAYALTIRTYKHVAMSVAGSALLLNCAGQSAYSSKRMPDGKQWTTENLTIATDGSSCYENAETNCRRYGRLYTWNAARKGCQSLGDGWRLPTESEWRQLAKHFGGIREDSDDEGSAAYAALSEGGAGFNALLGGGLIPGEGHYSRLEDHGFYWSSSESSPSDAWFYNFGKGGRSLNRQREGDKRMAVSVRCVKD